MGLDLDKEAMDISFTCLKLLLKPISNFPGFILKQAEIKPPKKLLSLPCEVVLACEKQSLSPLKIKELVAN